MRSASSVCVLDNFSQRVPLKLVRTKQLLRTLFAERRVERIGPIRPCAHLSVVLVKVKVAKPHLG